jgi:hypothetical protein
VNGLEADRAVPQTLESALLLGGFRTGIRALETASLGTRPTEGTVGIAESSPGVLEEAQTDTRRRHFNALSRRNDD